MYSSFWQYHHNIKINVADNRHFTFVYLLGKLDYSLYGQRNKDCLYMNDETSLKSVRQIRRTDNLQSISKIWDFVFF